MNRLEDSYALWKMICSCKLLENTQIILFLNKVDLCTFTYLELRFQADTSQLVEKKLKSGIRVKDHVPSYGERENDVRTAAQCKSRF